MKQNSIILLVLLINIVVGLFQFNLKYLENIQKEIEQSQKINPVLPPDQSYIRLKNIGLSNFDEPQYLSMVQNQEGYSSVSPINEQYYVQEFTLHNKDNRNIQISGQHPDQENDQYLECVFTIEDGYKGWFGSPKTEKQAVFQPYLENSQKGYYYLKNLEINQFFCGNDNFYSNINEADDSNDCLWQFEEVAEPVPSPDGENNLPEDGEIVQIVNVYQQIPFVNPSQCYLAMTEDLRQDSVPKEVTIADKPLSYDFTVLQNSNGQVQIQGQYLGKGDTYSLNWQKQSAFSHIGMGTFQPNENDVFNYFEIQFLDSKSGQFYLFNNGIQQYLCSNIYYDEPNQSCIWAFEYNKSN